MNLKELREYVKGMETLPDHMPVQFVTKRGDVKDIAEISFNPYMSWIALKEKKS